jgi:hypothetical protein
MNHHSPEKPKPSRPKWRRISYRVIGILLFLAAIWTFVKSLNDEAAGDVDVGRNYKGRFVMSNRAFRISFVLLCTGTVFVGLSMPDKPDNRKDKDDNA